jgi:phosphatidylinositol kinase/protein kinase (PI-3  family)
VCTHVYKYCTYACLHSIALDCVMHQYHVTSSNTMHHTTQHELYNTTLYCTTQQTGGMQKPLPLNQQQLSRAWDVSQRSTAADWNEWLRRLNVDLLKESPSPALRSCSALAQAYTPLARDLFHAAFVSCWHELSEQYQDSLVRLIFIL